MKVIELEFDKSTTRLAGFPYGETEYNRQVKDKINFNDDITIIFPNQIEKIASSFVQGFFSCLISNIGYKGIEKQVTIKANSQDLVNSIKKNMY